MSLLVVAFDWIYCTIKNMYRDPLLWTSLSEMRGPGLQDAFLILQGGLNVSECPNATQSSHHSNHYETFTDVHGKDFSEEVGKMKL